MFATNYGAEFNEQCEIAIFCKWLCSNSFFGQINMEGII